MANLYVGCSLTQAPEQFKNDVEAFKTVLKNKHTVFDFIGLVNGTPHDVYMWDIHKCVATCDALIAVSDYPSLGLGYELGVAIEKLEKPTLILAQTDSKVSRLLYGIEKPFVTIQRYADLKGAPALVEEFLAGAKVTQRRHHPSSSSP